MAKYITDAVDYFENLCVQHPLLTHKEASGSRIFEVVNYDQAFGDFKTGATEKSYFVRFIMPTMTFSSSDNNAKKRYQCGIMVGRYYSTRENDKATKLLAFNEAETVADDFVARMVADSRDGHTLFFNSIDKIENLNISGDFLDVQGDGSYAAVLYLFDFATFRCIDSAGSDFLAVGWLDL